MTIFSNLTTYLYTRMFNHKDRASRKELFYFIAIGFLLTLALTLFSIALGHGLLFLPLFNEAHFSLLNNIISTTLWLIAILDGLLFASFAIVLSLGFFCILIRRLHDYNHSGYMLIPYIMTSTALTNISVAFHFTNYQRYHLNATPSIVHVYLASLFISIFLIYTLLWFRSGSSSKNNYGEPPSFTLFKH